MRVTHKQTGLAGFVPDLASDTLPPDATSFVENLNPTTKGWDKVDGLKESSVIPGNERSHLFYWNPTEGDTRWFIAGATTIESHQGGGILDVTREGLPYNSAGQFTWNSLNFNGIIIFNNGADSPQFMGSLGKFMNFPALNETYRFRVVRKFKNYLLGLGVDIGGGMQASDIYWSHPADPGTMPASWDFADPTKDAGIAPLPSAGVLLDSLELVDVNVIYKSDATYIQRFIGGQLIFRFDLKFASQGILATGCVAAFENFHFVVTASDIIIHDGISSNSVADERVKRYFFDNLNRQHYARTFVVSNPDLKEIIIYYPTNNSVDGECDGALVWSWVTKNFHTIRQVRTFHAAYGFTTETSTTTVWDAEVGSWESDNSTWVGSEELPTYKPNIHVSALESTKILNPSEDGTVLGVPLRAVWERRDIIIGPISRDGVVQQSYDTEKTIRALLFNVETYDSFEVFLGTRNNLDDPIEWKSYGTVNPAISKRLDFLITCGFLSIQIETNSKDFIMRSLSIDFELGGEAW